MKNLNTNVLAKTLLKIEILRIFALLKANEKLLYGICYIMSIGLNYWFVIDGKFAG